MGKTNMLVHQRANNAQALRNPIKGKSVQKMCILRMNYQFPEE